MSRLTPKRKAALRESFKDLGTALFWSSFSDTKTFPREIQQKWVTGRMHALHVAIHEICNVK